MVQLFMEHKGSIKNQREHFYADNCKDSNFLWQTADQQRPRTIRTKGTKKKSKFWERKDRTQMGNKEIKIS